jgi:hypothetical protein
VHSTIFLGVVRRLQLLPPVERLAWVGLPLEVVVSALAGGAGITHH